MDIAASLTISPPQLALPPGAWDCHAHVFGPFDRFPLHPSAPYTPPLATAADYLRMLDKVGFRHGVLVHPSANGYDNSTTADALAGARDRLTGVCVVPHTVSPEQLQGMNEQGFRGIRFTENGHPHSEGTLPLSKLGELSDRLAANSWHAQVWAKSAEILKASASIANSPVKIIFDHMGFFERGSSAQDKGFVELLSLLRDNDLWVKLTPHRVSEQFPLCNDVRDQHDALIQAIPDRLVWGSDWPYIGMYSQSPDVGRQVDLFDNWIEGDISLRNKIFVANPERFYRSSA